MTVTKRAHAPLPHARARVRRERDGGAGARAHAVDEDALPAVPPPDEDALPALRTMRVNEDSTQGRSATRTAVRSGCCGSTTAENDSANATRATCLWRDGRAET